MGRFAPLRLGSVAMVAAAALAAAAFSPASAQAAGLTTNRYVALGDSYTSAPFTGTPAGTPLGCLRSDNNYPHVAAASINPGSFADVSCGGATTDDMFNTQSTDAGDNPPQLDAVTAGTDLVTLGIGGNDIGFSDIVKSCLTYNPFATPCKDKYVVNGVDELAQRIANTAPKIDSVLQGIQSRSPGARILVVGYPTILPASGGGCWPTVPYSDGDVAYLRQTTVGLNSMLAARAAANGATFVDTYSSSVGHDVCQSSGVRWVEGLIPGNYAAPMHPNANGEHNMGVQVIAHV